MKGISHLNVRQFSADKILKHLDLVNQWLSGGNPAPVTVELDMTNLCNHRCPECVASYFRSSDDKSLSKAVVISVIRQLAANKVRGLIFTGGGEPLCNPFTLKAVEMARARGLDVGFITNGGLLNHKACSVILKNCTWVRVSLDAGTPEVFKAMHGVNSNSFFRTLDGIKLLVSTKKKLNSKCAIGVGFLTCDHSVSDMKKAAKLGKKLGVDYLQFRPMQIHRGGRFDYHWTDVESRIADCLRYAGPNYQVLFSQHKYEMAKDKQYGRYYHKCYGQQFATVIDACAKMYICCHTRGYDKYCIGDLKKSTFKQIWNSRRREEVVSKIDFRDCIPLCRDNTFNQILWNIKQPREHVNFL